jgi:hypothetical protein
MKSITLEYLKSVDACIDGVRWWKSLETTDLDKIIEASLSSNDSTVLGYGNWLLCQVFTPEQRIQYAIYAAVQVLSIFEDTYPDDPRPRKAVEAAQAYLDKPSVETAYAARSAADAARSAADAAYAAACAAADAAADAADAAADAAYAAACAAADAARSAAYAADAAADAADAVARAAADAAAYAAADAAANAAWLDTYKKIVRYGLTLLEEGK